MLEGQIRRY